MGRYTLPFGLDLPSLIKYWKSSWSWASGRWDIMEDDPLVPLIVSTKFSTFSEYSRNCFFVIRIRVQHLIVTLVHVHCLDVSCLLKTSTPSTSFIGSRIRVEGTMSSLERILLHQQQTNGLLR